MATATPSQRVARRLREQHGLDIPADAKCRPTRAGHWQRAQGALSWTLCDDDGREIHIDGYTVGSHEPATHLLRYDEWTLTFSDLTSVAYIDSVMK